MNSVHSSARHIRVRISRAISLATLAASTLVGGTALLGPQAVQAQLVIQNFPPIAPPSIQLITGGGDYVAEITEGPTNINPGAFEFDGDPTTGEVSFELLFGLDPIDGGQAGYMEYALGSNAGNFLSASIDGICLQANPPGDTCGVTKVFTDINDNPIYFEDGTNELTFVDDTPMMKKFRADSQVNEMIVFMTYYARGEAELTSISDFYQTPGPLPVLGAGAAFGFSRKLRSRIKASRLG